MKVLGRSIGASGTRLLALSRTTFYKTECIYVGLYCAVQKIHEILPVCRLDFFIGRDSVRRLQ